MPPPSPEEDRPDTDRDGGDVAGRRRSDRNLPAAVGSAVIFAVLFLAFVFISDWALLAFVAAAMVIAVLEVDAALRAIELRPPSALVLVGGVAIIVGSYVLGAPGQLAALAATVLAVVLWSLAGRDDAHPLRSAGGALLMTLWIPFLASFMFLLLRRDGGEWYIVVTVVLTAASDIAAYAVGSRLGRRKLAPAISPGKTWEGVAGGVVATMVAAVAAPLVIDDLSIALAVVLGAVIAAVATIGDLSESMVKRSLGVKDLGTLLPGHGGMMDRVDALLFTLPVAHVVLLAGGL